MQPEDEKLLRVLTSLILQLKDLEIHDVPQIDFFFFKVIEREVREI